MPDAVLPLTVELTSDENASRSVMRPPPGPVAWLEAIVLDATKSDALVRDPAADGGTVALDRAVHDGEARVPEHEDTAAGVARGVAAA